MKCPKCGEEMSLYTSMVLTSYPPKYKAVCPKCGNVEYLYCNETDTSHSQVFQDIKEGLNQAIKCEKDNLYCNDEIATTVSSNNDIISYNMSYPVGDYPEDNSFGRYGWICPKCGRVLAPSMTFCPFCANEKTTINTACSSGDADWMKYNPSTVSYTEKNKK